MQVSKRALVLAGVAVATMASAPAFAHHSFAMFDNSKTVILQGVVKDYQWTNPHSWVQLMVKDPVTGRDVEWSLEGASPNGLARQGWSRTSAKPGDKAEIAIHPLKDGTPGGSLLTMKINGEQVGRERSP